MTYHPPRSTILQNFSPIAQTVYEISVTKVFPLFGLGANPLGQSSPKREKTWWTTRSIGLQNFIALCQPTPEISVTKNPADRQNDKQTVNDISPTCQSACGDNKYASCPDWRRSPHADRHHRKQFTTLAVTEQAAACFSHGPRRSGKFVAPG